MNWEGREVGPIFSKVLYPTLLGLLVAGLSWAADRAGLPHLQVDELAVAVIAALYGLLGWVVPEKTATLRSYLAAKRGETAAYGGADVR